MYPEVGKSRLLRARDRAGDRAQGGRRAARESARRARRARDRAARQATRATIGVRLTFDPAGSLHDERAARALLALEVGPVSCRQGADGVLFAVRHASGTAASRTYLAVRTLQGAGGGTARRAGEVARLVGTSGSAFAGGVVARTGVNRVIVEAKCARAGDGGAKDAGPRADDQPARPAHGASGERAGLACRSASSLRALSARAPNGNRASRSSSIRRLAARSPRRRAFIAAAKRSFCS
jgi:hypothetical protein